MINFQLIDIVNCISVFQLAFFCIYIFKKNFKSLSNKILVVFFLIQFIVLLNFVVTNAFKQHGNFYANAILLALPLTYLWGPLMFLYIRSQIAKEFKLNELQLLHLLPFLISGLILLKNYFILPEASKIELLHLSSFNKGIMLYGFTMNIQVLVYNLLSLVLLSNYKRQLKNISSSVEKQDVAWLKYVLYGYIVACIINELFFFAGSSIKISYELKQLVIHAAFMVFFNVLFYKAIIHPYIFTKIENKAVIQNIISEDEYAVISNKLDNFIIENKPYLNQNLTLKELSDLSGIPERSISMMINNYKNQTFYSYINSFRIEEAKILLSSMKMKKDTMLGIAFDAGFNSKSVFYESFKKMVGMTPSEYKKVCV